MNKIIIGLWLFLISSISISQVINEKKEKRNFRKHLKIQVKEQISQIHDGALLVRLKTKKNSIEALRKIEKNTLADKIEKKQAKRNKAIISAFQKRFDFCPTFFFFSDYSQSIKEKKFDKVLFLNSNLQLDSTIKFDKKTFLTAEFGTIEPDTAKYFSYYSLEPDGNWSVKKIKNYYGGSSLVFDALLIKSDIFIQLRRPFPYYARTFDSFHPKRVVKRMNRKLRRFYKQKNT